MENPGIRFDAKRVEEAAWEARRPAAAAWKMWQANNFDAVSRMVHIDACKLGISYVLMPYLARPILQSSPDHDKRASDISHYVMVSQRASKRLAAVKRWAGGPRAIRSHTCGMLPPQAG